MGEFSKKSIDDVYDPWMERLLTSGLDHAEPLADRVDAEFVALVSLLAGPSQKLNPTWRQFIGRDMLGAVEVEVTGTNVSLLIANLFVDRYRHDLVRILPVPEHAAFVEV